MQKLDDVVLSTLGDKVFMPDRVKVMMDETLQQRSHKLQAIRQEIVLEIAELKRQRDLPTDLLKQLSLKIYAPSY